MSTTTRPSRSLWQRGEDREALNTLIDEYLIEHDGEIGDDFDTITSQWLNESDKELSDKFDAYAAVINELNAKAEAREAEADRIKALATTDRNAVRSLKARLLAFMQVHDLPKFETANHKLSICKNGGVQPVVVTAPAEEMPEAYQTWKVTPNTDAIRAALQAEPGAIFSFARLEERGVHLRIK